MDWNRYQEARATLDDLTTKLMRVAEAAQRYVDNEDRLIAQVSIDYTTKDQLEAAVELRSALQALRRTA